MTTTIVDPAMVDLNKWNDRAIAVPHDAPKGAVDFESEFIGHLSDKEALTFFLQEGVKEALLYSPSTKALYAFATEEYDRSKKPPTPEMLAHEFPRYEFSVPQTSYQWLVEKLRERYRRSQVQETTRKLAELSSEPDEAFVFMRDKVFEIEEASGSNKSIFSFEDAEHFKQKYLQRVLDGFTRGFSIGFKEIDNYSGGVKPGHLSFILARPKRGKSWLECNAFVEQRRQGKTPFLATLEMNEDEMFGRIGCVITGLSYDRYEKGMFTQQDWKIWDNGIEAFKDLGPSYIFRPPVGQRSVSSIFLQADKLEAESVLIDQLSFIESRGTKYGRDDLRTAEIVYDLKNQASRSGSERPVIVAAQLNREADGLQEIASSAKAALTGAIEQAADSLYAIHQTRDMKDNGVLQFGLIDSRHSDVGDWMIDVEFKAETRIEVSNIIYEV